MVQENSNQSSDNKPLLSQLKNLNASTRRIITSVGHLPEIDDSLKAIQSSINKSISILDYIKSEKENGIKFENNRRDFKHQSSLNENNHRDFKHQQFFLNVYDIAKEIFRGNGVSLIKTFSTSIINKIKPENNKTSSDEKITERSLWGKISNSLSKLSESSNSGNGLLGMLNKLPSILGSILKIGGKLGLAGLAVNGAIQAFKGFSDESAKALYGNASLGSKIASATVHMLSGITGNLISPEAIADFGNHIAFIFYPIFDTITWIGNEFSSISKSISNTFNYAKKEFNKLPEIIKSITTPLSNFAKRIGNVFTSINKYLLSLPIVGPALNAYEKASKYRANKKVQIAKEIIHLVDSTISKVNKPIQNIIHTSYKPVIKETVKELKQQDTISGTASILKETGSDIIQGKVTKQAISERRKDLLDSMTSAGITDKNERAAFMAQADTETGGFTKTSENLHYSAKTLMKLFPNKFHSLEQAQSIVSKGQEAIGNAIYGGRMGNNLLGDGYKYRGRGDNQLTGKDNYAKYAKLSGYDILNHPELMENPKVSADVSVAYWKANKEGQKLKLGGINAVSRSINGGSNGIASRSINYQRELVLANNSNTKNAIFTKPNIVNPVKPVNKIINKTTLANNTTNKPPSKVSQLSLASIPMIPTDFGLLFINTTLLS